ncbi:MAG: hypothetical protein HY909_10685 [Deltaproteobacteria bacterium]|nr:hypothetical protein [Deltaproteobacteria bacterium]
MKIKGPSTLDPSPRPSGPEGTSRASFKEVVAPQAPASSAPGSAAQVVDELKAGRLSPDQAVERLVQAAVRQHAVPPAARANVEARIREALSRDPVLGALLRDLGAQVPSEPE